MVRIAGYFIPLEDETKRNWLNRNIILRCSECNAEHSFMTSNNIYQELKLNALDFQFFTV